MTPTEPLLTAADVRVHLRRLTADRLDAIEAGLHKDGIYMSQLEADLADCRDIYLTLAATEVASLRAELGGMQVG